MISIIIVNYKTPLITLACLESIEKHCRREDYEIILVDNSSTEADAEMFKAREMAGRLKLIVNRENRGFGAANNQAAGAAYGELLFFLNNDTVVKKDILPAIKESFAEEKSLGVLSPRLFLSDSSAQPYAYGQFLDLAGLMKPGQIAEPKSDVAFPVDWVSGAALVVRRELFDRLGGFDEKFFMYFEDMDLCKRAKESGCEIKVLPKVQVTHLVGASREGKAKQKRDYYDSQDYFFRKHYGITSMITMKLLRWPYRIFSSIFNG